MTIEKIQKIDIASQQLKIAIAMFLSDTDHMSAITLAGAADGILHGLVLQAKKEPFADYSLSLAAIKNPGAPTPKKTAHAKHINTVLGINPLKHHDKDDADFIELDIRECAIGAIVKAIANYLTLMGEDNKPPYINAMLQWTWKNLDGEGMMKKWEERPAVVKQMEAMKAEKKN